MSQSKAASPVRAMSPHALLLFPKFLANRESDIVAMREALARDDYAEIAIRGHRMRGNGASYGLPQVSVIGEGLEAAADAKDAERVRALVDELAACLEQVRAADDARGT